MHSEPSKNPGNPCQILWNNGKLIGSKPPLRTKDVWSTRTKLQVEKRTRDLAMFNLAIDSKLRGCDVVSLRVEACKAVRHSGFWRRRLVPDITQNDFGDRPQRADLSAAEVPDPEAVIG